MKRINTSSHRSDVIKVKEGHWYEHYAGSRSKLTTLYWEMSPVTCDFSCFLFQRKTCSFVYRMRFYPYIYTLSQKCFCYLYHLINSGASWHRVCWKSAHALLQNYLFPGWEPMGTHDFVFHTVRTDAPTDLCLFKDIHFYLCLGINNRPYNDFRKTSTSSLQSDRFATFSAISTQSETERP